MQTNVYDILEQRGLIAQTTHEEELRELLGREKVTFYIGFDPTADSLHIGHFLQMIVMRHMQLAGHRPIAVIGGGTAMVGDPSGRTDMRQMMSAETIENNGKNFAEQMSAVVDFAKTDAHNNLPNDIPNSEFSNAITVNNAQWLRKLNYVDFLREIGVHFSVNRMLTAESVKARLEKGLSFIEFNYMIMQAYDFLELYRRYGCRLQLGGDDQWSNILHGIELIRREEGAKAYAMTFNLLTTSEGVKMGKTAKGALWLNAEKCSPYDFYQYFRNVADVDVIRLLKMLTFIPLDEIEKYQELKAEELNIAKERLAIEVTTLVHGQELAEKASAAAREVFGGGGISDHMPTYTIKTSECGLLDVLTEAGFIPSKAEGRRLIKQNGLALNGEKVADPDIKLGFDQFEEAGANGLIVRKGKKSFLRLVYVNGGNNDGNQ